MVRMGNGEITSHPKLPELTVNIVSAYVANNSIQKADLANLIELVYDSLSSLGQPRPAPASRELIPVVSIKKSVTDDYLISLEDGRHYKSLKRHLSLRGLSPGQYREKWSLPMDYPMVARNYTRQRSEIAKSTGLGRNPRVEKGNDQAKTVRKRRRAPKAS